MKNSIKKFVPRKIRALVNYFKYKFSYPDVCVAYNAYLSKDTIIGKGSEINEKVTVNSSSIGECFIALKKTNVFSCKIQSFTKLYGESKIAKVELGSYSYIGERTTINDAIIGKFCSIGPCCMMGLGEHPSQFVSSSPVFYSPNMQCGVSLVKTSFFEEKKTIYIGNDVWIGAMVFVKDGVTIGNGAIVAAGSFVVNSVPPYSIVGGVPAKVIRYRFDHEIIDKLEKSQWWDLNEECLKELQPFFASEDINNFLFKIYNLNK